MREEKKRGKRNKGEGGGEVKVRGVKGVGVIRVMWRCGEGQNRGEGRGDECCERGSEVTLRRTERRWRRDFRKGY